MNFRNYTPHDVDIVDADGQVILTVPREAEPIRLAEAHEDAGSHAGVPIVGVTYGGAATALPPQEEGTMLIVSMVTAMALRHRRDLVYPVDLVRDDAGNIIGSRKLGRLA